MPSLLDVFLHSSHAERCTSLRQVVCGGETLPVALKHTFFEVFPTAQLYHAYGPTEAAISVTHWDCRDAAYPNSVPLGRPIANTQLYILDQYQRPVPVGVPGELYIGGLPLARGYLNRAVLTAEKFVANPFDQDASSRLYRTGDLARFLPDGNIEFLGRRDHQVKLRGFRIELGELESVLNEHPAVRQAVVVARDDASGDKRLVAYVVPEKNLEPRTQNLRNESEGGSRFLVAQGAPGSAELRQHLGQRLPEYMVPSAFVLLDELPLTTNGKVDRTFLMERTNASLTDVSEYVIPRNHIGFDLTRIWQKILGVEHVGVHDNFFELGGHSLFAIRLASEIAQTFPGNDAINITHIFKHPTIAGLTKLLSAQGVAQPDPLITIQEQPDAKPLFLVHPGEGLAFVYNAIAGRLRGYSVYGINNPRYGDANDPFVTVEEIASYYIDAILSVKPEGPYALGGWSFGGVVAFEMARQLEARGYVVESVLLIDSYNFAAIETEDAGPEGIDEFLADQGFDPGSEEGRRVGFELAHNGQLSRSYQPQRYTGRVVGQP